MNDSIVHRTNTNDRCVTPMFLNSDAMLALDAVDCNRLARDDTRVAMHAILMRRRFLMIEMRHHIQSIARVRNIESPNEITMNDDPDKSRTCDRIAMRYATRHDRSCRTTTVVRDLRRIRFADDLASTSMMRATMSTTR